MNKRVKLTIYISVGLLILLIIGFGVKQSYTSYYQASYKKSYVTEVTKFSTRYNIDENLIYAVIRSESDFDASAESDAGARGLMQITEDTFNWLKDKIKENDPRNAYAIDFESMFNGSHNIQYGTYFLAYLLNEFKDENAAIAAYHAGRSKVHEWLKDSNISPNGKLNIEKIPFEDTKSYVQKVTEAKGVYKKIY